MKKYLIYDLIIIIYVEFFIDICILRSPKQKMFLEIDSQSFSYEFMTQSKQAKKPPWINK